MYTAFLAVARACGAPGLLAALMLGQLSNLMGCLTTYGIGSAPPYFGAGYVPQADWLKLGAILSVYYLAVWIGSGLTWWKVRPGRGVQDLELSHACTAALVRAAAMLGAQGLQLSRACTAALVRAAAMLGAQGLQLSHACTSALVQAAAIVMRQQQHA